MDTKLLEALVSLVHQGGSLAIWGIFVWLFLGILKVSILGGILWGVIKTIGHTIHLIHSDKLAFKEKQVPILSDKVSSHILGCIEDYHKSIQTILSKVESTLEDQANALKEKSNTETKKTA